MGMGRNGKKTRLNLELGMEWDEPLGMGGNGIEKDIPAHL